MKSSASKIPSADKDKLVYFQPGEMVYLIKHNSDSLAQDQIEQLFKWSNDVAASLDLFVIPPNEPTKQEEQKEPKESKGRADKRDQKEPKVSKEQEHRRPRVYPFSPKLGSSLSSKKGNEAVPGVNYKSPQIDSLSAFTLISADVRDLMSTDDIDRNASTAFVDNSRLVELILLLDGNRDKPSLDRGVSLEVVSPNWLMSASSESGGTGGPGARPVPFTYEPVQTSATGGSEVMDYPFNVFQNFEKLVPSAINEWGNDVKVAILDTAPSLHELAAAYERWQKVNPALNCKIRHKLIETLLRPNGPLTVHPASYNDLLRMRSVHLKEHDYKITDHGLFVAGIIHTIAPAAEIHLYEVLNPDGVGDLESIAKGLWEVFDKFAGKPLVVNCSLVLNVPLPDHQIIDLDEKILANIVEDWDKHKTESIDYLVPKLPTKAGGVSLSDAGKVWLERQGRVIKWICDLLYLHGSRVIAAAGNDWKQAENPDKPQARYPAAFDSVLGVGALPKDIISSLVGGARYITSSYSNLADKPGEVGVTTFGGEGGEKNGVLGVYIGEFPMDPNPSWWQSILNWLITLLGGRVAGPKNLTDMAWWAGTSFSTAIVTGAIAAVLSSMPQPAITEDAIVEMYTKPVIMNDRTVNHEDALDVTQG